MYAVEHPEYYEIVKGSERIKNTTKQTWTLSTTSTKKSKPQKRRVKHKGRRQPTQSYYQENKELKSQLNQAHALIQQQNLQIDKIRTMLVQNLSTHRLSEEETLSLQKDIQTLTASNTKAREHAVKLVKQLKQNQKRKPK